MKPTSTQVEELDPRGVGLASEEIGYFVDSESPSFFCKPRRKVLALEKCLTDFLNANAFEKRRSVCWRCSYGRKNREAFADE